jgi:hypothetical protein
MVRSRRSACTVLAGLAGLGSLVVLGACRADAGDPLSTWVGKADDICHQAQADADASRPVLFQPSLADTLQKSSTQSKSELTSLRAVDLPGERRAEVRDYLGTLEDRTRELDLLQAQAAHPGPDFKPPSLDTLENDTQKATDQSIALGLKECRAGIDLSVGGASSTTTTAADSSPSTQPGDSPPPNATDLDNFGQDQAG